MKRQKQNEALTILESVHPLPSVEQLIVDLQNLIAELDRVLSYDTVLRIRDKAEDLALRLNYQ